MRKVNITLGMIRMKINPLLIHSTIRERSRLCVSRTLLMADLPRFFFSSRIKTSLALFHYVKCFFQLIKWIKCVSSGSKQTGLRCKLVSARLVQLWGYLFSLISLECCCSNFNIDIGVFVYVLNKVWWIFLKEGTKPSVI